MGCRTSKEKFNKEGEKQKMFKVGLALGRNALKLDGNFQLGYHSKIDKKYTPVVSRYEDVKHTSVDGCLPVIEEKNEENETEDEG